MAAEKNNHNSLSAQLESLTIQAPVGFIVVDSNGHIRFTNRLAEKMFGYNSSALIDQPVEVLIPQQYHEHHVEQRSAYMKAPSSRKMGSGRKLFGIRKNGESFPVEVGLGYARNRSETFFSAVIVDISRQERIERERERLIADLQTALSRVKQLRGLLPICASCKKIRDDKGYWKQIEAYIQDHSEAEFSHGICPDCARTLYPDLDLPGEGWLIPTVPQRSRKRIAHHGKEEPMNVAGCRCLTLTMAIVVTGMMTWGCAAKPIAADAKGRRLTWNEMTIEQRKDHMKQAVLPRATELFRSWRPARYDKVDCRLCHGQDAMAGKFHMPTYHLPRLSGALLLGPEFEKYPDTTRLKLDRLVPMMSEALGKPTFNIVTRRGFGCYSCHLGPTGPIFGN